MSILHAAFASSPIFDLISKAGETSLLKARYNILSEFVVDADLSLNGNKIDPLFVVADNIISRGLPTLAPVGIERRLIRDCGLTKCMVNRKTGSIGYLFQNPSKEITDRIAEALCLPFWRKPVFAREEGGGFNAPEYGKGEVGDGAVIEAEKRFLETFLPSTPIGKNLAAFCDRQTPLATLLLDGSETNVKNQTCDFSIPLTGDDKFRGFVFEVDGRQHGLDGQKQLDVVRDHLIRENKWETVRFSASGSLAEWSEKLNTALRKHSRNEHFRILSGLAEKSFFTDESITIQDAQILKLVYLPIGVARICKVLTRLLCAGKLRIDTPVWKMVIIERDVECGEAAIETFKTLISNLFALEGLGRRLPSIECNIIHAETATRKETSELEGKALLHLVIDVATATRSDVKLPIMEIPCIERIRVRSVYRRSESRRLLFSSNPVEYKETNEKQSSYLTYLLRDIFRKVGFRPKQLDIIKRTLHGNGTVALLPTGSGKSLTYQLSTLLQPGVVLVVAPLKSLMRDQRRSLFSTGIDCALFVNSSLNGKEKEIEQSKLANGYALFAFVSPERFVIEEFRQCLKDMGKNGILVSFVTIDEAHCVSEWGHDFRTAYLRLGSNARANAISLRRTLPILGLTGTASFDVLADVQRELGFPLDDESNLVFPKSSERKELHFEVFEVPFEPDQHESLYQIKRNVGIAKKDALNNVLLHMAKTLHKLNKQNPNDVTVEKYLAKEEPNAAVIFCPCKGDRHPLGTKGLCDYLQGCFPEIASRVGFFNGTDDKETAKQMEEVQDRFMKSGLSLLVATKAFGMGIDKATIRFTLHTNYPQSIEAFAQEAGRAGRDRDDAICMVMYSPTTVDMDGEAVSVDKLQMLGFHENSFPGEERERLLLWDLLDSITFPNPSNATMIGELSWDELELDISPRLWTGKIVTRLYLNYRLGDAERGDGSFFNISKGNIFPTPDLMSSDDMEKVASLIRRECPLGSNIADWLKASSVDSTPVKDGLDRLLESMTEGEERTLVISVENGISEEIAKYLIHNKIWSDATATEVVKMAKFMDYDKEHLESFGKAYIEKLKQKHFPLTHAQEEHIAGRIVHMRMAQDTHKAVYRLCCVGAVQDYTILFRGNLTQISMCIKKVRELDYISAVVNHIGRYVSRRERDSIPEEILGRGQGSILRNCLDYILNFTYTHIAEKRRLAIDHMEEAVEAGMTDPIEFATQINTYFDSRYLHRLRPLILNESEDDIWVFLEEVRGRPDEAKHLRGACRRLLEAYPHSGLLKVLSAYAGLVLGQTTGNVEAALRDMDQGIEQFSGNNQTARKRFVGRFIDELGKYNEDGAAVVASGCVAAHITWLTEFNRKYRSGVRYGDTRA